MQITDVRVRKITKEGKMKAIVSITIDDEFVVHDIKVIEGEKGLFIAMPSKKPQTASTVTLHIPSIPEQGISSRRLFGELRKSTCRTDRGLILEKTNGVKLLRENAAVFSCNFFPCGAILKILMSKKEASHVFNRRAGKSRKRI